VPRSDLGYRTWTGPLRPRILRCLPIARAGVNLVFRRRIFRFFFLLGLLNFLFHFAIIYFVVQVMAELPQRGMRGNPFVDQFIFTGTGKSYRDFIYLQDKVVTVFLAFAGSILVGNDFRFRSVAFYLSKPIGKLEYFLGKLGAIAGLAALITLVPALVLFLEYGAFTESLDYYIESQRIFWAILGYGALVSLSAAVLLLGVSALLERTVPIAALWCAILVFLPLVGELFRELSRNRGSDEWAWSLLNYWTVLRWISNVFFGIREEVYGERLLLAVLVLAAWMSLSLGAFWWKVRAVDVVR
jgi:ABC-2 type transport system permease protein